MSPRPSALQPASRRGVIGLQPVPGRQQIAPISQQTSPPRASKQHLSSSAVSQTDPRLALFTALIPTSPL